MAVDTALYPAALNTTLPTASDFVSEGDDNFRAVKTCFKTTFSNVNGALTATHTEFNYVTGVTSPIQAQITAKANSANPTFTGTVVLPATTSIGDVTDAEIARLSGVTSSIQTQLNAKGAIAGQAWTGSHSFSGAISVPTVTAGDSSTNAASTAFVAGTAFSSALPGQSGNAYKFVTTDGANASWGWPTPKTVLHTTNGPLVVGRFNVATVAGITLSVPATVTDDPIEFMNASSGAVNINFGAYTVKGQTPDSPMSVPSMRGFRVINTGSTLA